ncbi:hypothetical protein BY458DRAFT_530573 [Sporodiniella umbellata]|nr:hypothetical protein BY458DRAFT_530573 [Sporodiniella umbellata]
MGSADKLPNEILTYIFRLLSLKDQFQCQAVCKSWLGISRINSYREVRVNNTNILLLLRCFDRNGFSPFLYVKSLIVHFYPYFNCQRLLDKEEFCRLIQYCSNLEKLMIAPNSIYWDYLTFSPAAHIKQLSYPEPPSRPPSNSSSYYSSLYKYREHLNRLDIHCACDLWIRKQFGHLLSYIEQFPNVRQLTIDGGSRTSIVHLNSVLKACQNLESLHFWLDHPFLAPGDEPVREYGSLLSLSIYLPAFSIESLEFILQAFPKLRHLNLRIFHGSSHSWTREQSAYVQTRLVSFLNGLSSYTVKLDMEGDCELIECSLLSSWHEPNVSLHLDFSSSSYARTQMDLIKGVQNQVCCKKTFRYFMPLQDHVPYFKYLGNQVTHLSIKESMDYMTQPGKVLRSCPQLTSLTLESPEKDISIQLSDFHHQHLNHIVLKRTSLTTHTLKALCSLGQIQTLSLADVSVTQEVEPSYLHLSPQKLLERFFIFMSGKVVMHNVVLQTSNGEMKTRYTQYFNSKPSS